MTIASAISNGEVYLQGKYLGIGINADGTLGTTKNAPAGIYTNTEVGLYRVGMYADLEGFDSNNNKIGNNSTIDDVLLQGRAIEGFNIGYKLGGETVVQSNQLLTGYRQMSGTLTDASNDSVAKADWIGATKDKLVINQSISLADDASYIRIDVTLTNKSSATMSDVRYMRTADPDQSGLFATGNRIEEQNDGAAVSAKLAGAASSFFMYSDDNRAVASFYGFVNTNPYVAAAYSTPQAEGYAKTVDQTLNLTFGLGALRPGESTKLTLYMGVTADFNATRKAIDAGGSTPAPTPVNLAPVTQNDLFAGSQDGKLTGNVLLNDKDPEGKALTASLGTGPANGTVQLSSNGSFVYTPKAGWSGTDSFTYAASDGVNKTAATVKLTVAPTAVNLAPVVTADAFAGNQDSNLTGNVLLNDRDPEGKALTATIGTGPLNGTVRLAADGNFIYTPNAGWAGRDSFTYVASDGVNKVSALVRLRVDPVAVTNLAPVVTDDAFAGAQDNALSGNVLTNDNDPEGKALTASLATGPTNGTIQFSADGSFVYTPNAGWNGSDSFTYAASDGVNKSVAAVSLTVDPAPVVIDPVLDLLQAFNVVNGSSSASQVLRGTADSDVFYFETAKSTGSDRIVDFGANDLFVTDRMLFDGNNDGIIQMSLSQRVLLDAPRLGGDSVFLDGVYALRFLGLDAAGNAAYANANVRPRGAVEGTFASETFSGDSADRAKNVFFYDTALRVDLGNDTITNFGKNDLLVLTSQLNDSNNDNIITSSTGRINLSDGSGTVMLQDVNGATINAIEFDGTVVNNGLTYYVYSLVGSTGADVGGVIF
ncbi:hypothetical protein DMC47_28020 [Nostoc sp. 3335mG]|nr:hypothetical protein DMC47_28020 [Nostoc sp. 3335mG]